MRRRPLAAAKDVPQTPIPKTQTPASPTPRTEPAAAEANASVHDIKASKDDVGDKPKKAPAPRKTVTERFGIWEIESEVYTWRDYLPWARFIDDWAEIRGALPFMGRFVRELISVGPLWMLLYTVLRLAQAFMPAVKLNSQAQALRLAQEAINTREISKYSIMQTFLQLSAVVVASNCLHWTTKQATNVISYQLRRIFDVHTMKARFRLDLPALEDENIKRQRLLGGGESTKAWEAMEALFEAATSMIEIATSFSFLLNMLREKEGDRYLAFIAFCGTFSALIASERHYSHDYWSRKADPVARRIQQLRIISSRETFYKDILAFGLGPYFINQFVEGSDQLSKKEPQLSPHTRSRSPLSPLLFLRGISDDLTLITFVIQAISTPKHVPLSFVTYQLIKQTTQEFSWHLINLSRGGVSETLAESASTIRSIYESLNLPTMLKDGNVVYERTEKGMDIELKNVSFAYAGSSKPVLQDVSMVVPRGSFVCIVGSNGSGKSTLMKLLSRLLDTSEGEILINGRPIRSYSIDSLRSAIAVLWQDHSIMPLTLGENIGIGKVDQANDVDAIRRAAVRAGCADFIEDLQKGFDSNMAPPEMGSGRVRSFKADEYRPPFLTKEAWEQERQVQLSGGQLQRKFPLYQLMSCTHPGRPDGVQNRTSPARDIAYILQLFDEPTASLDAQAERELFLRVQSLRGTKTIVWVSHRLHLARHADQVVMIDKGRITEIGRPDELLASGGLFSELYSFQTQTHVPK